MGQALISEIWNVRVSILEGLGIIFNRLDSTIVVSNTSMLNLLQGCLVCMNDGKVIFILILVPGSQGWYFGAAKNSRNKKRDQGWRVPRVCKIRVSQAGRE